ncbi:MAG: hypothetical protein JWL64_509 [Frankiales bacterium]|nr:hypothetical protein [Frankiales bacterium]
MAPQILAVETLADVALDEALVKIGELSHRLWAVRTAHRPGPGRLACLPGRPRVRCTGCGHPYPCETARAARGAA